MKKLLRIASVSVIFAMAFLLFACSQEEQTNDVFDDDPFAGEIELDFGGVTVTMCTNWVNNGWNYEIGFSTAGDNQAARYKEMKEKYNCNIAFISGDQNTVTTRVAAGIDIPDLVDVHSYQIYPLYVSGMIYSLDDIDTIDPYNIKWGDRTFIRYGNFDGKQYGFYAYNWEFIPQIQGTVEFDSVVLSRFGLTSPHEMLENGTWTWSEFEKMLETATVTEGDKKYTGLSSESDSILCHAAVFSNGGEFVTENTDGTLKSGITSPEFIEALDWVASLNSKGYIGPFAYETFNNNEFLFAVGESYRFSTWSQSSIDNNNPVNGHAGYGFVPFPTGPRGEYGEGGQYVSEGRRLNWIVSAAEMDKNDLGKVLDLLFAPLQGQDERAWDEFLRKNIFHYGDVDGYIFLNMVESVHYDWSVELSASFDGFGAKFTNILMGRETAISAMEAIEDNVQARLDVLNGK